MTKSKRASVLGAIAVISAVAIGAAHVAQASDKTCRDHAARIAELEKKLFEIERRLDQLPTVSLGPIVRNADGSVRRMTHGEAVSYCATRGGLPTVRQLALAFNAKAVSDTAREFFYEVSAYNEPAFYYNYASYERPPGDEGNEGFWSSSIPSYLGGRPYVFLGVSGYFGDGYSHVVSAVRCVGR